MAHFAEIDSNNIVLRVLTVSNEQEQRGNDYLSLDLGLGGRWIQTSYNHNFKGHFAGVGHTYNEELDLFVSPKPYPSWILNTTTGGWNPPIPCPNKEGKVYKWNEHSQSWDESDAPVATPLD